MGRRRLWGVGLEGAQVPESFAVAAVALEGAFGFGDELELH